MNIVARFRSDTPLDDMVVFLRKQALIIIALGALILAAGIILGAVIATLSSLVVGSLIFIALIIVGACVLYYGIVEIKKSLTDNTIIQSAQFNEIIIYGDSVSEEQVGDNYNHKFVVGNANISRVIKAKGLYQFRLTSGLILIAKVTNLVEGNINDLDEHLRQAFGKRFSIARKDNFIIDSSATDTKAEVSTVDITATPNADASSSDTDIPADNSGITDNNNEVNKD